MHLIPYVVAYAAIGIFFIAAVARIAMWVKAPMHVRWELYPVPHEAGRAHYGGSYLEESKWWEKKRETSFIGEMKAMITEIVFLAALWEHNRKLWFRSFPFHFGLYMVIVCTVLMMGTGVLMAVSPSVLGGWFGKLLQYSILISGAGGLGLSFLGALGLLHRRLTDPELTDFTAASDIFNLVIFIVAFGLAIVHFVWMDRDFGRTMYFIYGLVTFKMLALPGTALASTLQAVSVILLGLLVAYIPLTHMSHFIGKYFAYHSIRWNDAPNLAGGPQEKPIGNVLGYPVSWAAPHIQGEGKKTWADVATEDMKK